MAFSGLGVIAQFHSPLKSSDWNGSRHQPADSGRRVLVKQLGRGISETTVANGEDVDATTVHLLKMPRTCSSTGVASTMYRAAARHALRPPGGDD